VDEWLNTGRDSDGSEWPSRRDLLRAPNGWLVAAEFLEQSSPCLNIKGSGLNLSIAEPDWGRPWSSDFFSAQEVQAARVFVGILASVLKREIHCISRGPDAYLIMRTGRPKKPLLIADEEHEKLRTIALRPKSAQALALRARIVLFCAQGLSNSQVAGKLHITSATVGKWRERFRQFAWKGCSMSHVWARHAKSAIGRWSKS